MFRVEIPAGYDSLGDIIRMPLLGNLAVFALISLPAALASFCIQQLIPELHGDVNFTKIMLIVLPTWNLLLWVKRIRIRIFFIPVWLLLGIISTIKAILGDYT